MESFSANTFTQNMLNANIIDENVELLPAIIKIEDGSAFYTVQTDHLTQQDHSCVTLKSESQDDSSSLHEAYESNHLYSLLKDWKLEKLYPHLEMQKITIEILKIIKLYHIEKLLRTFDMGTQILFEHNLEKWRESIGRPLQNYDPLRQFMSYPSDGFIPIESTPVAPMSVPRSSPYPRPLGADSQHGKTATLGDILIETKKGKQLVDYYNEHNQFKDEQRSTLINAIAQYFHEKDLNFALAVSYRLEQEIVDRFPSERLEYYRTAKRGRIYNKYSNMKSNQKSWTKPIKKNKNDEINDRPNEEAIVREDDAETIKRLILDDKLSVEEFDHLWKACIQSRLMDINESSSVADIFEKWPHYKKQQGFRLIDIDFSFKYKTAVSTWDEWASVRVHIHEFLTMEGILNNKTIRAEIDSLVHVNLNENSYDAILLWALHGYLVPWQRVVNKDNVGKNIVKRFTIADSQDSFIVTCKSNEELEDFLSVKKNKMENIQPFIVTIGESLREIKEVSVFFDDLNIPVTSVSRAVDVCFKIYFLFNLQFPKSSTTFWNFIQLFFYNIKSKETFSKVNVIINELKKKQENSQ